jgi:uncharacterized protein YggE
MFQKIIAKLQTREGITFVASCALIVGTVMVLVGGLGRMGHRRSSPDTLNNGTLTVSGKGETIAIPDIATFTYMVTKDAKSMTEAQTSSSQIATDLNTKLIAAGVLEKDIKMDSFNANPTYTYPQARPCSVDFCPPVAQPTISGYSVSQSYTVKVRDISKASDVSKVLTDAGVSSINGPSFEVDNVDAVQNEARDKAIVDAREQAQLLARQLGVKLDKIIDFQVSGNNGYPVPMYAAMDRAAGASEKVASPDVRPGESNITSQVTITYRLR